MGFGLNALACSFNVAVELAVERCLLIIPGSVYSEDRNPSIRSGLGHVSKWGSTLMTTDADSSFLARLRHGPAFLFLGQAYLKLQAGDDALLALIVKKYGGASAGNPSYNGVRAAPARETRGCSGSLPRWSAALPPSGSLD